MSDRRAPSTGYRFGNKRQYRRDIWTTFAKFTSEQPPRFTSFVWVPHLAPWESKVRAILSHDYTTPHDSHAILMPSLEGDEIDVAQKAGFHQSRLHVVDKNPAIVATLKRRFPEIQTYGVDLMAAIPRIRNRVASAGQFARVANLDLTSSLSHPLLASALFLAGTDLMHPSRSLVAVTCLRGRESSMGRQWLKEASQHATALAERTAVRGLEWLLPTDAARLQAIGLHLCCMVPPRREFEATARARKFEASRVRAAIDQIYSRFDERGGMHYRVALRRCGVYSSGRQTMLWGIFELRGWDQVAWWQKFCVAVADIFDKWWDSGDRMLADMRPDRELIEAAISASPSEEERYQLADQSRHVRRCWNETVDWRNKAKGAYPFLEWLVADYVDFASSEFVGGPRDLDLFRKFLHKVREGGKAIR